MTTSSFATQKRMKMVPPAKNCSLSMIPRRSRRPLPMALLVSRTIAAARQHATTSRWRRCFMAKKVDIQTQLEQRRKANQAVASTTVEPVVPQNTLQEIEQALVPVPTRGTTTSKGAVPATEKQARTHARTHARMHNAATTGGIAIED